MKVKLGEVCEKASSSLQLKEVTERTGKYPVYGASGIVGRIETYHRNQDYVAIIKDGAGVGRVMILPKQSSVIGTLQYLLPKSCIINSYLYYAIQNLKLGKYASGSAIPHIYFRDYKNELIELPSTSTQHVIVSRLDALTHIIDMKRQQLRKLDELVKCRFVEMFGDCRVNPKQWATKKLEDIAAVGSSKRVFVEELVSEGIPFYRGTEIGALADGMAFTPELYISKDHYSRLCAASGKPSKGDLLMPSICPDGRIWVVDTDKPFYFKDGRVLWVHDIHEQYNPIFLLYTLKDRIIADYNSIASGTTFAELKIFTLKQCKVFDVPLAQQNTFASFVQQLDKSRFAIDIMR